MLSRWERIEHINPGLNWIGAGFLILVLTKSLESLAILNGVFVLALRVSWSSCPGLVHVELQNRLRILSSPYFLGSFGFLDTVGLGKTSLCCCHLLCHHLLYHFSSSFRLIIFILYVWEFCHHIYLCTTIVLLLTGAKGKELSLQIVLSHWVLGIEPTSSSTSVLNSEPSIQSLHPVFFNAFSGPELNNPHTEEMSCWRSPVFSFAIWPSRGKSLLVTIPLS